MWIFYPISQLKLSIARRRNGTEGCIFIKITFLHKNKNVWTCAYKTDKLLWILTKRSYNYKFMHKHIVKYVCPRTHFSLTQTDYLFIVVLLQVKVPGVPSATFSNNIIFKDLKKYVKRNIIFFRYSQCFVKYRLKAS